MSRCGISEQIAIHANQDDESWVCFGCDEVKTADDESHEIKTRDHGYQFICDECLYTHEANLDHLTGEDDE